LTKKVVEEVATELPQTTYVPQMPSRTNKNRSKILLVYGINAEGTKKFRIAKSEGLDTMPANKFSQLIKPFMSGKTGGDSKKMRISY